MNERLLAIQAIAKWHKLMTIAVALDKRFRNDPRSAPRAFARTSADHACLEAAAAIVAAGGSVEVDGRVYEGEIHAPGCGGIRVFDAEGVKSEL